MAKLMTLLTALILAMIALYYLYYTIHWSESLIGTCVIPFYIGALIYIGCGTFTAYLFRAGRKL